MVVGDTVLVYDQQYRYLYADVEVETAKAMLIGGVWLPKSQMTFVEPRVWGVPEWLVDENLDFFTHDGKYSERRVKVLDIRDTMRSDAETRAQQQLKAWTKPPMDEDFLGV
ncbi:MAG: hypothetical protein ACXQT3_02955 [Methermicoccaceae archaeon]